MAENSKISWTDHTFNPWWGCVEVSPACDNCYAREFDKRVGGDHWNGKMLGHGKRRVFGDKHWNEPLKWNRNALKEFGRHARVFCASMADVFEVHPTAEALRPRLLELIKATPNLQWNLLTKRALEIKRHEAFLAQPNVSMGVTVESQTYDWRIVPAVEWLSLEPLLRDLDIRRFLRTTDIVREHGSVGKVTAKTRPGVTWVIIGGESGPNAREMKLEWVRSIVDQCRAAFSGVAVHFKQTGDVLARKLGLKDRSGKDSSEWPEELRIQEFPKYPAVP